MSKDVLGFLLNPTEVSMAEQPVVEVKPAVETKIETKTADKPVETAGKPTVEAKPAVESKPAEAAKTEVKEGEQKPSEQLKSLLEEAGEEEVKLGPDGKPLPKEEAKTTVPEKYEFKLPEGYTLSEAQLASVSTAFKELGLDNVGAQKLVDLQLSLNKANEDAHVQAWEAHLGVLKQEAKDYFSVKLPEVMRNMARARDAFIPKLADGKPHPLEEKFNVSGLAFDKDFVEFMDRIGRVIGEGRFVEGKRSAPGAGKAGVETPTGKEASLADVYPSMAKT